MSRLTSTDIFYLDLEETQPFQDVRIKSATGTTVFLSKLYLASLSPMLKAFLSCDPEEATIVTNFNHQDLEIVSKFCSQGVLPTSINELEAGALFRCFGISLVDELFKNESLKIEDDFDYNYTKPKFVPEEVKSEPLEETLSHREVDEDDYSSQFEDSEDEPILSKSRKRKYSTTEKTTQLLSKYNNYKEVQEKYKDYLRVTIPNLGEPEDVKFTNYKPLQPLDEFWKPPRAPSRKKKKPAGYEDYPLNCKLCSKRFTSDILKAFHIKVYHNSHYQCPYCPNAFYQDEAFKFKKHLYKHEHVTKTAIPHECIQCGKTDFCLQRLQKHIDNFRGPFHNNQCTQCHERFSSHEEYRSHVDKAHYGIWKFRCDDCEKVFDTLQLSREHRLEAHKRKQPPKHTMMTMCDICGKVLKGSSIPNHMKIVHMTTLPDTPCPHCGKIVKELQRHIKRAHEKLTCDLCGKLVPPGHMLRHNDQYHTAPEERRYKCEVCNKGFCTKQRLTDHLHTHTGEKPYTCQYCGKGFANSSGCRLHVRFTHLGQKRLRKK